MEELGIKLASESNNLETKTPAREIKVEKKEREVKVPTMLTGLLGMILVMTYVLTLKTIEPANHILITGGIVVYPFTFLITAYICRYYGLKQSCKSIFISSLLYTLFLVIMSVSILPKATSATSSYNNFLQYIFASSSFTLGDMTIFYPNLGQFFSILISFLASHLLFAGIYNAIKNFTMDYLSVGLALFISYIIDRLLFIPILYAKGLSVGFNTFDYVIQCLTSEFIFSILCCVLIVILYAGITLIKNKMVKSN